MRDEDRVNFVKSFFKAGTPAVPLLTCKGAVAKAGGLPPTPTNYGKNATFVEAGFKSDGFCNSPLKYLLTLKTLTLLPAQYRR
jgi:hypothetical protein